MAQNRSARRNASERLLSVIEYPEKVPNADGSITLRVDGKEVLVEESEGRIVLSRTLTEDDSIVPTLASYAAGRMLREDAVLAYGSPSRQTAKMSSSMTFLWQDASADASDRDLLRLFETFMDSCDWWQARVDSLNGRNDGTIPEAMVIRP